MRSLWNDEAAARHVSDLARCAYACGLLGEAPGLIPWSGSSASVKLRQKDVFGEERDVLAVTRRGCRLKDVGAGDFVSLHLRHLTRLAGLDQLPNAQLVTTIKAATIDGPAPAAAADVLLHASLPHKVVIHVYPEALLAIANTPGGIARAREAYGDAAIVVPYVGSAVLLARRCAEMLLSEAAARATGAVLMQQGLVAFGDTAQSAYERVVALVARAEQYVSERSAPPVAAAGLAGPQRPVRGELAALRQAISESAGFPVSVSTHSDAASLSFARRDDVADLSQRGPAVPGHAAVTKRLPLLGRDVQGYAETYEQDFAAHTSADGSLGMTMAMHDPAPRVILDPELGMCAVGRTAEEAAAAGDIYRHTMAVILAAEGIEAYRPLPAEDAFEAEYAAFEQACRHDQDARSPFAGEVALVTGAASGIGRACVASLLARGAAVAGLDINPRIAETFDGPAYLGLCCDVTDEDALCQALETTVRAFGGLDMLVPNAGIFPPGCAVASLQTAEWRKVMRVNLDANLVLMREAYPMLRAAPRGGRVVVVSSRNVPAPGPGAVAYSASKAALTQLARVAALEWGKDSIRVNILNPHAVFDTGIWTDEVLNARAAHYGLTVAQYKRNNVLGVEVTSHDVGELVAEMCGPLFAKSTGAQVPVDGGSNRVI